MAYNPPNTQEIIDRLKTYVKSVLGELNPTDQNSFIYSLIVAMANLSNDNNLQLKLDIIPNSFVSTVKNEEALQPFAELKNLPKKLATISEGKCVISGEQNAVIPIGTNFVANNVVYKTTQSVSVNNQSISISNITCNGKTVTVTTASNHNFASNIPVTIAGCSTANFNGTFPVVVIDFDKFTYQISTTTTATETNTGTASATIAVLTVRSQSTGLDTQLFNGDSLAIEEQIPEVSDSAYTMFSDISGGTDDESYEEWKERIVYRYQNPITYFNVANIVTTARTVEGVTRVWVKEMTPIIGQVTVYFVRDNDTDIIPDANEIEEVETKIKALRTVKDDPADIFVYAPTPKTIDFTFNGINPDTPTMRTAIKNSIQQLFTDNVELETSLSLDKIKSAIQYSYDLESGKQLDTYTLLSPSADVTVNTGELAIMGTVTFL